MAVLNNIIELLGFLCILAYPMSVFPFVLMLLLKYPLMLKFMNIDYPPNIHQFFTHQYAFETKWIYFYTFSKDTLRDLKVISNNFEVYRTSPYFLDNIADKIIRVLILIFICLIMFVVNKVCQKKLKNAYPRLSYIALKFNQLYLIALPLSFILQYFFEITFYMWSSLQFATIYSAKGVANFVLSIIFFILFNLLLLKLYKIQVKQYISTRKVSLRSSATQKMVTNLEEPINQQSELYSPECYQTNLFYFQIDSKSKVAPEVYFDNQHNQPQKNQFSLFSHDFIQNGNFYSEYFIFLVAIKYYILSFILALFQEFLSFQLGIQCLVIIAFGIFNLKFKPYANTIFTKLTLIFDLFILCYQLLLMVLIVLDFVENPTHERIDSRMAIGWMLMLIYLAQIMFILLLFIFFLMKMLLLLIKQFKEQKVAKEFVGQDQTQSMQTKERRFNPLLFRTTNQGISQNTQGFNIQETAENNNLFHSKINYQEDEIIENKNLSSNAYDRKQMTSLQLKYLAEKLQEYKEQKYGSNIEAPEVELQDFQELDLLDNCFILVFHNYLENRQSPLSGSDQNLASPGLPRSPNCDSPLLKKGKADEFSQKKVTFQ